MATQIEFSKEQIELIKTQIAPKATDDELKLFLYQCKRTGLDPLTRQIYCQHRNSKGVAKMTIQTAIDGFRVIAERSGDYGGQSEPEFKYDANGDLLSAKIIVYRFRGDVRYECAVGVAFWSEYVVTNDEWVNGQKTGKKVPNDMWGKMKHTMLAKVAEALALRKAYPQDLSGLYTTEEMAQVDNVAEETPVNEPHKLDQATSVPFTPQYNNQAQQQTVPNQSQQPQQQNNSQQTPPPPVSPYTKKYTDVNTILAVVKSSAKVEELTQLYFANREFIEENQSVKDALSVKRDTIKNQGKVIITDSQFKQVCDRIAKGDATVLENAIKVYILNAAQVEQLQHLDKERLRFEEALKLKYYNPADIATMIENCKTTDHVLRLHKNNAMIVDRDPELLTRINAKLRVLKSAA